MSSPSILQRFHEFVQRAAAFLTLDIDPSVWNGRIIAFDTETYYDEDCTIKTLGNHAYTRHPKFDAYMISVHDGEQTWVGHPKDFQWESLAGAIILSHNAAFDQEVYLALVERGLAPRMTFAAWHCTANLTSYLCGRRSLAQAVEVLFGTKLSKQARADAKGKTWDDMIRDGSAQTMLEYAGDDAVWCWKLWKDFGHLWPEHEKALSHLTIEQGRRGVQIDVPLLEQGIQTMQRVILESVDKLPWVKRGRAEASPIGIAEECRLNGIPGMPVKAHDPEAAEEWLETYSPKFPWVQGLKDLRKAKKMLATLETIKLRLRPDGTLPFSLLYFGAHTGRWAGTGGLNMQNLNKDPLFGFMVRDLFIARPGKKLIIVDLSQIEPRCLNWLIGNEDLLSRIRGGEAIYEAHARLSMGWTGGKLKKENPKLYALAKAQVLALGYGAGWEKFISMARTPAYGNMDLCAEDEQVARSLAVDGQIYTDEKGVAYFLVDDPTCPGVPMRQDVYGVNARTIVQSFRQNNPLITGLWGTLQDMLERSVGRDMEVELPSGRVLRYKNVQKKKRRLMDKKTGEMRERWVLSADVEGYETKLYGGILTENLVQAVARDVFALGMLNVEQNGIRTLWSVHDELICEVDPDVTVADVMRLLTRVPDWMPGLPVEAEGVESQKYLK